jgi:MFS family permease
LLPRFFSGLALGFVNINTLPTLFDLFGASLMSERPHQEIVTYDDVRRQGGGVGVWLGIWVLCFNSSLSIGFCVGACIISGLTPSWGFYIVFILLAFFLLINVVAPETRRAPYRRSISQFVNDEEPEKLKRRVARGEVKLHVFNNGPKWWYEEVWAGIILMKRLAFQPGFFILMWYLAWVEAELNLILLVSPLSSKISKRH